METKTKQVLDIYFVTAENYTVRKEKLNDADHLVVPVVMMVEGVHVGSHGPILHLAEELGRYPESWDGIPVTIGHPNVNGAYVSANSPDVLHDWAVGRIFNTRIDGTALRAEAWVSEDDLMRISEETLNRINSGELIEVSVGVFSDEEQSSGVWNTENYNSIARNHRPNHLALLPDEVGACSLVDGCGIRVNQKGGTKVTTKKEDEVIVNKDNQSQVLKELNRLGFSVNEVGYNEIREKITSVVYGFDGGGLDNYLEDVFNDYFIYLQFNNRVEPRVRKLYKQAYKIDEANNIVLDSEPINVKKEVSYDAVPNVNSEGRVVTERVIKKNNKKTMCTECVKKLADELIANKSTAWNDDDREFLESQTEAQLEKMTPPVVKEPEVNTAKSTREDILAILSEKPMTNDEFLGLASPDVRSQIEEGLSLRTNQQTAMVSQIIANTDQWTEDELKEKDFVELQKLHKVIMKDAKEETVYVGAGEIGGRSNFSVNKKGPQTIMLPKGVKQKEQK